MQYNVDYTKVIVSMSQSSPVLTPFISPLSANPKEEVTRLNAMLVHHTIDTPSPNTSDEAIRGRFIAFTQSLALDLAQQAPSETALRYYLSDELGDGPLAKSNTLAKQVGLQWISTHAELDEALDAHLTALVTVSAGLPTPNASAN
jgi:hypothetical protein